MNSQYFPIDTLLATHRGIRLAVAVQAYYDGSGKSNNLKAKFLTLAGYAGTPDAWYQFEKRWAKVLKRWGCQYLHMEEANSLREEFAVSKGWTHERVNALLADLFNECLSPTGWEDFKGQFYGASCTMNLVDYRKARVEKPTLKDAESICVDYVVTIALRALPENCNLTFGKEGTVELFFDKGEPFMNKIWRVWDSKPNNKLIGKLGLVSHIGSVDSRNVIGVQAADFLAWHTNRYYTHGFNEKTGAFAGLVRLFAAPSSSCYYDYEKLKDGYLLYYPCGGKSGKEAKDTKRTRNPHTNTRRVRTKSKKGNKSRQITPSQPEEVTPQTSPDHHHGGYNAKNTHLGSPEDV